jgi:hypothetical protein
MKDRVADDFSTFQVFHDDALEQRRRNVRVPHPIRIDDYDWTASADAKAWRFSAFYAVGSEEKSFALQQRCKLRVKRASASIGRAEATCADDDVSRIRLHYRITRWMLDHAERSPREDAVDSRAELRLFPILVYPETR